MSLINKTLLALICCLSVSTQMIAQSEKPVLKFGKDGRFKIMQVTDVHYNLANLEHSQSSLDFIREAISLVKPDFIMLTGDIVVSNDTRKAWQNIADVLDKSKIPWAVVFGNHDSEYELTNRQIIEVIEEYRYNLTENGCEDISGNGNYALPVIASSTENRTAAALYCFDTHKQNYWIDHSQIEWYRQQSLSFAVENGGNPLPALAFYHIPVPEFNAVIGKATTAGVQKETVCCPELNSGSFVAMRECKDVMGIFVGHDHDNNYIGCLHDICLAYGYKSGRQSYGVIGRGVRVVELYEGERKFSTWLLKMYERGDDGKIWSHVETVKPESAVTYPDSFR